MRIGIDARLIHETGVGRYIQALIKYLPGLDSSNDYVVFVKSADDLAIDSPNWQIVKADIPWHTLQEQWEIPKIYHQAKLDFVHIPYFAVPILIRTPFIVTIHDLTISHFATGEATTKPLPVYFIKRLGYQLVMQQAIKKSVAIITVSNAVKDQLQKEYRVPKNKIKCIYESGEIESDQIQKSEVPQSYILYVGNAHPHKNLQTLIDAYLEIIKEFPHLKLVMIGKRDYFYSKLIGQIKNKGLADQILFPGEIANEILPYWYTCAQAFVFPSLSEGFGIPGLEAMNLKCPVIASDIPVFHEIYGEAALYFDPKSSPDLVNNIKKLLLNSSLRADLIDKGKNQANRYSWKKMVEETLKVYESSFSI